MSIHQFHLFVFLGAGYRWLDSLIWKSFKHSRKLLHFTLIPSAKGSWGTCKVDSLPTVHHHQHFQTTPLKPLDRFLLFHPKILWVGASKVWSHDQDSHHPHILYKPFENFLKNLVAGNPETRFKAGEGEAYQDCPNNDPRLTFDFYLYTLFVENMIWYWENAWRFFDGRNLHKVTKSFLPESDFISLVF